MELLLYVQLSPYISLFVKLGSLVYNFQQLCLKKMVTVTLDLRINLYVYISLYINVLTNFNINVVTTGPQFLV